jgi:hypothetical protein
VRAADEVEHREARLPLLEPEPAAELLEEERRRFRRPEEEDRVDRRHVDARVEEILAEATLSSPVRSF